MRSIMQTRKECWMCRELYGEDAPLPDINLHRHHVIFGNGRRAKSEKYGLTVWLCPGHHEDRRYGVHFNENACRKLQGQAQEAFELNHSREEWMKIFGRNYLE